uniref:Uncharacterized protein n=1 Tax=Meloidogyne hapla TaxID=6305 RepID=A0A1I8B603_MELHA
MAREVLARRNHDEKTKKRKNIWMNNNNLNIGSSNQGQSTSSKDINFNQNILASKFTENFNKEQTSS